MTALILFVLVEGIPVVDFRMLNHRHILPEKYPKFELHGLPLTDTICKLFNRHKLPSISNYRKGCKLESISWHFMSGCIII